jgi:hypothetical protein
VEFNERVRADLPEHPIARVLPAVHACAAWLVGRCRCQPPRGCFRPGSDQGSRPASAYASFAGSRNCFVICTAHNM